ncbi:MAG: CAP domain-containing protein [bacterium]
MTLLPIAALLTLPVTAQAPNTLLPAQAGPNRIEVRVYVEKIRCVTTWRGRQRKTVCTVVRRGPSTLVPPSLPCTRQPSKVTPRAHTNLPPLPTEPRTPKIETRRPSPPVTSTPTTPQTIPPPAPAAPPPVPTAPPAAKRAVPAPTRAAFLSRPEAEVVRLLNQARARLRLGSLRVDQAATQVARAHSRDMCLRRFFSHRNPDGKQPWHRLKAGGVRLRAAAENIASGQRSALEAHNDWLGSPGHRANRLNGSYSRMGVGVYNCAGVPYWTEVFVQ